jgi:hypothetical protein
MDTFIIGRFVDGKLTEINEGHGDKLQIFLGFNAAVKAKQTAPTGFEIFAAEFARTPCGKVVPIQHQQITYTIPTNVQTVTHV